MLTWNLGRRATPIADRSCGSRRRTDILTHEGEQILIEPLGVCDRNAVRCPIVRDQPTRPDVSGRALGSECDGVRSSVVFVHDQRWQVTAARSAVKSSCDKARVQPTAARSDVCSAIDISQR
jgi:hypothetical protein